MDAHSELWNVNEKAYPTPCELGMGHGLKVKRHAAILKRARQRMEIRLCAMVLMCILLGLLNRNHAAVEHNILTCQTSLIHSQFVFTNRMHSLVWNAEEMLPNFTAILSSSQCSKVEATALTDTSCPPNSSEYTFYLNASYMRHDVVFRATLDFGCMNGQRELVISIC